MIIERPEGLERLELFELFIVGLHWPWNCPIDQAYLLSGRNPLAKIDTTQTLAPPLSAWGRLAANSTAHMVEHLFNGVIAVILPLITTSLGLSLAQAGALASARTLMAGAASFPSGFFADLASRRNLFLGLCLGMIGLSCLGLSAAWSFFVLLIFMALGGAGGGGFHPQSLAILSAAYREKRAFALGVHDSSANLGEVIGPLALGLLITFVDWRTALQIWAIPGLAIGLLYALFGGEECVAAPAAAGLSPRSLGRCAQEQNRLQSSGGFDIARHGANRAERVSAALFIVALKALRRHRRGVYVVTLFFRWRGAGLSRLDCRSLRPQEHDRCVLGLERRCHRCHSLPRLRSALAGSARALSARSSGHFVR